MVNVDFASPSLVLGTALIGAGIALLQARNMQRRVSRDADIVVAAMVSIVGSTLIFQGWRLDPLLLLCQALTTSVAVWYGLETFKLRGQVMDEEVGQPGNDLRGTWG
ncbi:MAG: Ycf66 protein N-terminus-domain-containing protein [Monoraphidium minutum]|nr:MAG: Ycf66 protein N-terminus-domain-containing protein [Monoraphidium minutum]